MESFQNIRFAAIKAFLLAQETCFQTDFRRDGIEASADATRDACRKLCVMLGYDPLDLAAMDADFIATEFGPMPRNPITEEDLQQL